VLAPVPWLSLLLLLPLPSLLVGVLSPLVGVVVMPGVVTPPVPLALAEASRPPSSPPQPTTAVAKIRLLSSLRMVSPTRVDRSSHPTP
jgi:hypothetical protein